MNDNVLNEMGRAVTVAARAERDAGVAARPLTPVAAWRRAAIVAIKTVHTAIFALVSGCIMHVCWAGVVGRPSRWTPREIAIVLAEMAVFAGNRGRCPLTQLAEAIGAERGRVTDIFLPRWFADRIPQIYTPPFLIGVLALVWRRRVAVHAAAG